MKIDIKKHLMDTSRIHRDMGDPLTIEDLADLALDIQTKNIEAQRVSQRSDNTNLLYARTLL
ncbi:hypothetical protein [uncultured Paraglaciecola sp.]|uniref:hypothetical protein n=1 Tax=uncultured Paraglaciecola sp. TaxID=1765024 RepID=UPI00262F4735|nr:hypothetical protein [uncultured Paraglaciecola sp.]